MNKASNFALGTEATCRTCAKPITYTIVTRDGFNPRETWSDGHARDPWTCFSAISLTHSPDLGDRRFGCPFCGASSGEPCISQHDSTDLVEPHGERRRFAAVHDRTLDGAR